MKRVLLGMCLVILGGCSTHPPGHPDHNWLNGVWNGKGINWEQTFKFEVVDGNKIVGWQESRNDKLRQVGWGQMTGEINGDTIKVTVYKGTTTVYSIRKTPEGNLINQGIILRKQT